MSKLTKLMNFEFHKVLKMLIWHKMIMVVIMIMQMYCKHVDPVIKIIHRKTFFSHDCADKAYARDNGTDDMDAYNILLNL